MTTPRVSVLLPVYNGLPYLPAAVESVLAQTYTDFELVAVDDGSTDGSGAWLDAAAARDARVRVVRQPNAGIVAALNRGLAACRGEFVARMDADDRCYPERLERQVAFLDAHPAVGAVGSGSDVQTPEGLRAQQAPTTPDLVRWELLFNNPMTHPTVTLRRSALERVGGYRADFPHNEDYDLWDRLCAVCDVTNLPERLLLFNAAHDANVGTVYATAQFMHARCLQHALICRLSPDETLDDVRDLFCLLFGLPLVQETDVQVRIERAARLVVTLRDAFVRAHPDSRAGIHADAARKLTALETALRWRAGAGRAASARAFVRWDIRAFGASLGQRVVRRFSPS